MNSSLETIRHPELSNHEGQTASYIVKWLQEANATRILTGIGNQSISQPVNRTLSSIEVR